MVVVYLWFTCGGLLVVYFGLLGLLGTAWGHKSACGLLVVYLWWFTCGLLVVYLVYLGQRGDTNRRVVYLWFTCGGLLVVYLWFTLVYLVYLGRLWVHHLKST